jgi:hypothetical protein
MTKSWSPTIAFFVRTTSKTLINAPVKNHDSKFRLIQFGGKYTVEKKRMIFVTATKSREWWLLNKNASGTLSVYVPAK